MTLADRLAASALRLDAEGRHVAANAVRARAEQERRAALGKVQP